MKTPKAPAESGTTTTTTTAAPAADTRTAKVLVTRTGARACGFTLAKGALVPAVPLAHAEYLVSTGAAEILEVQ